MLTVTLPASKSLSNRAMVLGLKMPIKLENVLKSDDTLVMFEALQALGVRVEILAENRLAWDLELAPMAKASLGKVDIFVNNAGTATRFLVAMLAFSPGLYYLFGTQRMHERPIADLIDALLQIGAKIDYKKSTGCLPLLIEGQKLVDGERFCEIGQEISSQYLSGLLLAAAFWPGKTFIKRRGLLDDALSQSYIDLTIGLLADLGFQIEADFAQGTFALMGGSFAADICYKIEPDFSAASYWVARAVVSSEDILLKDLVKKTLQGDKLFIDLINASGLPVKSIGNDLLLEGSKIKGASSLKFPDVIDCANFPDAAMTLAVLVACSGQKITLSGLSNLRLKECDRLAALVCELNKVGVNVKELADGLIIEGLLPEKLLAAEIETYDDHRMAMSFAVLKLINQDMEILHPECVSKTYPSFWEDWL